MGLNSGSPLKYFSKGEKEIIDEENDKNLDGDLIWVVILQGFITPPFYICVCLNF